MEPRITEQNKIKQIAREYEKKGYNVKIEPKGSDLPYFIQNYEPDLIATNETESVVIEVKTRADMATIETLKNVADTINDIKGWRFELVITTSRQEADLKRKPLFEALEITNLNKALNESKELVKLKYYNAAFILTWSYLESLSRQLLLEDKKNLANRNPLTLIKTLFSFGYISRRELESLEQLFEIRNQIVHGYQVTNLDKNTIERLIEIIKKIASENQ